MDLLSNSSFALFLIIAAGYIFGRIQVKGISLDVSAVIFVALVFGHFGFIIPQVYQSIGLLLFIFTIGIQAGPGFFESFKKNGRKLAILAISLIISSGVVTYIIFHFFHVDKNLSIGLLTGALTSTPGLAAAIDTTKSPLASIGYGIAYPFGVIGVILFVGLLPKILRAKIKDAEDQYKREVTGGYPEILNKNFVVDNENVIGKTIGELREKHITEAVISRVMHDGVAITPSKDTVLHKGDIIKAVGSSYALDGIRVLIGPITDQEIPLSKEYDVRSVLVTKKDVIGKTLEQLNLYAFNANITRVRRAGIDISPSSSFKLQLGDKVIVACAKGTMSHVIAILGDDNKQLSDTDFLPIAVGICLGTLMGEISLKFGTFEFSMGLTGGILLTSLVLGRLGRTGPFTWTMTGAANQLLRQLGLLFFLAAVGTSAGQNLASTFEQYGLDLFFYGALITLIPMIFATVIAKIFFKMNILTLLGALTGSMTSTPGLASVDALSDTDATSVAYATVYPIAMVLLMIVVQILSIL